MIWPSSGLSWDSIGLRASLTMHLRVFEFKPLHDVQPKALSFFSACACHSHRCHSHSKVQSITRLSTHKATSLCNIKLNLSDTCLDGSRHYRMVDADQTLQCMSLWPAMALPTVTSLGTLATSPKAR